MDVTKQSNQTDNATLEKMVTKHLNFLQTLKNLKVHHKVIILWYIFTVHYSLTGF